MLGIDAAVALQALQLSIKRFQLFGQFSGFALLRFKLARQFINGMFKEGELGLQLSHAVVLKVVLVGLIDCHESLPFLLLELRA